MNPQSFAVCIIAEDHSSVNTQHFNEETNQKYGKKNRIDNGLNWVLNEKSNTLTTKNIHPNQYILNEDKTLCSNLSVVDYERLQTIPEGYTSIVNKTHAFEMIGNGWTVDVIAHIFSFLK